MIDEGVGVFRFILLDVVFGLGVVDWVFVVYVWW